MHPAFEATRFPQFRLLWAGLLLTTVGTQMQFFAVGWLAVQVAVDEGDPHLAPFYLGLIGLARAVPALGFTLIGGVYADRVERRSLLIISRLIGAVTAVMLAGLVLADIVTIGILMAFTLITAISEAIDMPARTAIVARILPRRALDSALGLTSLTFAAGFIVGPLIGGVLIVPLGVGGLMVVKAAVFVAAVAGLFGVERVPPESEGSRSGVLRSVAEGLAFILREPGLRVVAVTSVVAGLFGRPLNNLLPAVAANMLDVGAIELSWLLAATGIGGLVGSLVAASLGGAKRRLLLLSFMTVIWGVLTFLLSIQRDLAPAVLLAGLTAVPWFAFASLGQVLFQVRSSDQYRGRAASVYSVTASGVTALGVMLLGSLGTLLTVSAAIAIGGIVMLVTGVASWLWVARRPELEAGRSPAPAPATRPG